VHCVNGACRVWTAIFCFAGQPWEAPEGLKARAIRHLACRKNPRL
jgi:hypothetical protein